MNENTSASIVEIGDEPVVTFIPPLYEQRRAWVLNMLRRKQVSSVVDIGCGEGSLLACLCNPALYLSDPSIQSISPSKVPVFDNIDDECPELHVRKLDALDISLPDLKCTIKATAPPEVDLKTYGTFPRWEPLDVRVWHGGLECFNEEFVGAECIVATEVIEHLPSEIFQFFAPVLLGSYRPIQLLITTPSYTFNARFIAPDASPSASTGFRDPTGRTERVFRHRDHKFEWTVEEFKMYCNEVAQTYGYDVELGGIGKPVEDDPWGRDNELGFATQVAAFTRKDSFDISPPLVAKPPDGVADHKLLITHHHSAHPLACQAETSDAIQMKVLQVMSSYRVADGWTTYDLWVEDNISEMCGGILNVLLEALDSCEYLTIEKGQSSGLKWLVKLTEDAISFFNIQAEAAHENLWDEQESWPEEDMNEHNHPLEIDYEDENIWTPINSHVGHWAINEEDWDYTSTWSDAGQKFLS